MSFILLGRRKKKRKHEKTENMTKKDLLRCTTLMKKNELELRESGNTLRRALSKRKKNYMCFLFVVDVDKIRGSNDRQRRQRYSMHVVVVVVDIAAAAVDVDVVVAVGIDTL